MRREGVHEGGRKEDGEISKRAGRGERGRETWIGMGGGEEWEWERTEAWYRGGRRKERRDKYEI